MANEALLLRQIIRLLGGDPDAGDAGTIGLLDEVLLDDVIITGASASHNVLTKKQITLCIVATDVTNGFTINVEGSPNNTDWGTVACADTSGSPITDLIITDNGTYFFEVFNASTLKYIRANVAARFDGTIKVYVAARV